MGWGGELFRNHSLRSGTLQIPAQVFLKPGYDVGHQKAGKPGCMSACWRVYLRTVPLVLYHPTKLSLLSKRLRSETHPFLQAFTESLTLSSFFCSLIVLCPPEFQSSLQHPSVTVSAPEALARYSSLPADFKMPAFNPTSRQAGIP